MQKIMFDDRYQKERRTKMNKTKIPWTERTWNPVTGCTKWSAGCAHCYAETMAKRLQGMGQGRYANGCTIDGVVYQEWPKVWKGGAE